MKESILEDLRKRTKKAVPMIGRTLRLPPDLDKEINDFCKEHALNRSVLYRRIVLEGWELLKSSK